LPEEIATSYSPGGTSPKLDRKDTSPLPFTVFVKAAFVAVFVSVTSVPAVTKPSSSDSVTTKVGHAIGGCTTASQSVPTANSPTCVPFTLTRYVPGERLAIATLPSLSVGVIGVTVLEGSSLSTIVTEALAFALPSASYTVNINVSHTLATFNSASQLPF